VPGDVFQRSAAETLLVEASCRGPQDAVALDFETGLLGRIGHGARDPLEFYARLHYFNQD
jgi:hypothetical protein